MRTVGALALFGVVLAAEPGARAVSDPGVLPACRCAQRNLADYYEQADEVVFARLEGWQDAGTDRRLDMTVLERPWKVATRRGGPLDRGQDVSYVTAVSTASCGLQPVREAVYVVFAFVDADAPEGLRVDTCSGTRVHRASPGAEPEGFTDVPGRFVVGQLDALSGLDVLGAVAAAAPDASDPGNETLVGLLDLKALAHGGSVPVRGAPDAGAPLVATVRSYADVRSREVGYEVPAAVVVARRDGWYRIRLESGGDPADGDPADGSAVHGWVAPEDAGTWFPYADLPVRRLAYLTGGWSGHVWPGAGAGIPTRDPEGPPAEPDPGAEYAVDVHESTLVGGMPWFRVDVLSGSPCEGPGTRVARAGWVPGYDGAGQPLVWFYSRGC